MKTLKNMQEQIFQDLKEFMERQNTFEIQDIVYQKYEAGFFCYKAFAKEMNEDVVIKLNPYDGEVNLIFKSDKNQEWHVGYILDSMKNTEIIVVKELWNLEESKQHVHLFTDWENAMDYTNQQIELFASMCDQRESIVVTGQEIEEELYEWIGEENMNRKLEIIACYLGFEDGKTKEGK
ncbi:TPA: hypothetical protein ACR3Z0_006146 [Bacillus thuringiensis]|uniref:Uncharacterized protein n=1 Tax=Bacillus thuringiensis TaxID=1428 RepID=A0A9X6KN29_BACTU|nr:MULTISPECIES: hypothetical protein [Bacillus cereus group]AJA23540.1 hypothetical protein BT4G5_32590 [Bacillus thuringiensis serovar galleriae]EJQ96337.1 hypothetical protein II5_06117 [Bacillus cereus MSX-A1]ETE93768.1 hypothetical protein C623_0224840 [Bacillus thuringiensis serovar aizawai str. Hu4-2]KAB1371498.1 hypothetical protein FPG93_30720 [Bacillus thuringiensis]KXI93818.1 hypothetical protein ACS47_02565 [Bacillus cereus]